MVKISEDGITDAQTCRSTYFLIYLLTPQSKLLLGKFNGPQLVTKFPAFHGTRRFMKAFASAHRSNIRIHFYVSSVNTLVV
jgi:hypothetical protein